jgi:hypothetical protein
MLNTIKAKSLKESGIITEHTSNKIVVCAKKEPPNISCVTAFWFISVLGAGILVVGNTIILLSSGLVFQFSNFIIILLSWLILIGLLLFIYNYYISMRKDVIYESFCVQINNAEFYKYEKTYSGDEHIEKYSFDEVEKILIIKKIYSENPDEYHVFVQLLEGRIPILSGGFYEKIPALDLAECINQFINLPPDSIEITQEFIM